MRISDAEVKKLLASSQNDATLDPVADAGSEFDDTELIARVTRDVVAMPDREDRIAELKAMIEAGNYQPSGDEIAEAMVRRAIADRVRR